MDVHEDIHRAAEHYHDQHEFRRYLNSALQNARGVTFLLQKRKAKWQNFDEWYGAWVEQAKLDDVLTWSVRSRNRIVKEEDLATFSVAEVAIYGERLKEAEDVFLAPATASAEDILRIVVGSAPRRPDASTSSPPRFNGSLRIFRKWIDSKLPNVELIAALRVVHEGVALIVAEAHRQTGVSACAAPAFARECVTSRIDPGLRCIPPYVHGSNIFLDGRTGHVTEPSFAVVEYDPELAALAVQRYGTDRKDFNHGPMNDLEPRLRTSRAMLRSDGFAAQFLMFYRGPKVISFAPVRFSSEQPREVKIQMAIEALNGAKYDGAMLVSEMWLGRGGKDAEVVIPPIPPKKPAERSDVEYVHYDPDPVGGRREALSVVALSAYEPPRQMLQVFRRTSSGFEFDEPQVVEGWSGVPFMLKPVVLGFTPDHT
ncbi:hypothetical protein [Homoserinimonas sp. A520]